MQACLAQWVLRTLGSGNLRGSAYLATLRQPLIQQIPHPMPKGFTAALILGFGAPIWTLNKRSFAGGVLPALYGFHYLEHMLGVIFPVRCHMQHNIGYKVTMHQINNLRLIDMTLMMLLFMPWVGEIKLYSVQRLLGDTALQHIHCDITKSA